MVRVVFIHGLILVCLSVVGVRALAQEGVEAPAPTAASKTRSAPKPPVAAKPKPKPAPVKAAPLKPLTKAPTAQPPDNAPAVAAPIVRAPVIIEKVAEKPVHVEPVRPAVPFDDHVISQFCTALSGAASDGRLAWQARRLDEMEARLRDRIAELEAKRAETADWLKRREEAQRKADEIVVAIYAKMKPDAAAAQFSAMDESGAAAILAKLNPRAASIVLNEIEAPRAARIAAEMAGVGMRREAGRVAP